MTDLPEKTAEEILGSIKIPPQPEILIKVERELEKDEPSLAFFSDTISSDVGLSSAVLRIINSPFYGLRSEINSVHHAISLLGLVHIKNLWQRFYSVCLWKKTASRRCRVTGTTPPMSHDYRAFSPDNWAPHHPIRLILSDCFSTVAFRLWRSSSTILNKFSPSRISNS